MTDASSDNLLHKAYREQQDKLMVQRLRVACILGLIIVPAAILLDVVAYYQHLRDFLVARFVCVGLVGLVLLSLHRPFARRHAHKFAQFVANVVLGYNAVMILLSDGVISPYYAGLNLVVLGLCLLLPWSFKENLSVCLASLLWYFTACALNWFVVRPPIAETGWFRVFFNNAFIMLSNVGICGTAGYFAAQLRFRDFRLQYELDRSKQELEASLSELNQNKKALEESYGKLKELDEAKSHFFANLSHELRTPLTLILSPLDALRGHPEITRHSKLKETLHLMYENGLRLLSLINDLLELVRLEQGKLDMHFEPVDLKKFLPGIISAIRGVAERRGHLLEMKLDPAASLIVKADKDRLEKIFINLLFNAIKFTAKGGQIHVCAFQENGSVLIDVQDTGIGIAEENLNAVFDRFWQEHGSATRSRPGTGIGLSLVRELVELHHGAVSVTSKKGEGSTFRVQLPVSTEPVPAESLSKKEDAWLGELYRKASYSQAEAISDDVKVTNDSIGRSSHRHTLLLVEDDVDMQRFLISELSDSYNVILASDGQLGWDLAHERQPKLVLTDMMLPKIDGITLCRQLRASPSLLPTKIVLITARGDDRTKLDALEAGADDFLVKPFSIVELKTRLANLLLTGQLERELQAQNQMLESTLKQLQMAETQLIQNARLSALGSLSAGIMHEINNPVNFMLTAVHYLKTVLPDGAADAQEAAGDIQGGLKRIRDIISDLKEFAYGGASAVKKECDPEKIVRTAKRLLAGELNADVRLEEEVQDQVIIFGSENQLVQLLVNVLQNALHATAKNKAAGKERVVRISVSADTTHSILSIWDNGTGIKEDHRARIFDPFFTTKDVGQGTGLGLSICHTIVKQHGGEIVVQTEWGRFTQFMIRIPSAISKQPELADAL
jgi:signal transduction histidine kinase